MAIEASCRSSQMPDVFCRRELAPDDGGGDALALIRQNSSAKCCEGILGGGQGFTFFLSLDCC
jgi:hypothetical protein